MQYLGTQNISLSKLFMKWSFLCLCVFKTKQQFLDHFEEYIRHITPVVIILLTIKNGTI
jgi:hypothetical protein